MRYFLILIFSFSFLHVFGQNYNYQHYDLQNGISGLTVYKIVQDKNGFIWFATETGLSRFDGTRFKNFSTADGLPDNEILDLFVDSKNRLWILPFAHSICYYKDGVIHTQKNDSLLANIKLESEPANILEDDSGGFVIIESRAINAISSKGVVRRYDNISGSTFGNFGTGKHNGKNISVPVAYGKDHLILSFMELDNNTARLTRTTNAIDYKLSHKANIILKPNYEVFRIRDSFRISSENNLLNKTIAPPEHLIGLSSITDSIISFNCSDNVLLYNIYKATFTDTFPLNKIVNCSFKDSEGNFWFATNGYGVYRLTTTAFINYNFIVDNNSLPVYSLSKSNEELLVGTNQGLLWNVNLKSKSINIDRKIRETGESRVTGIARKNDKMVVGGGSAIAISYYDQNNRHILLDGASTKRIYSEGNEVLIATNIGIYIIDINKPVVKDIMFVDKRTTCAIKIDDDYFIGTLNGLFKAKSNGDTINLGEKEPLLASRISALAKRNGSLWIATYGNGIVELKDDKVVTHLTERNGITSNMCRDIAIDNDVLWVGTDKGLNRINIKKDKHDILTYTSKDGMSSNLINCLGVQNDSIFMGTPSGLIFFNPKNIDTSSISILNIDRIESEKNKWTGDKNDLRLAATDNRFYVEYSCVSFKSNGNITYYYKLGGADNEWHTTNETFIDYASLPHGDYQLQLYAINAFGKKSNQVNINFSIDSFFYQKTWFLALVVLIVATVVWFFVSMRIRKIKKQEYEKLRTQTRLTELEQMAFRAQMNPHFIFNCLNSIQQYIFSKSALEANRFITEFSSLIRQTLDISSKKYISLEEEIKYISTYLGLEQTRFDNSFDYNIYVSEEVSQEEVLLPPLLLQPFVENAIRHGVRNLKDERGKIDISFYNENEYFVYKLEDNGIGIEACLRLRGKNVIEHQSKGMTLIQKRIETLNDDADKKITLEISDIEEMPKRGTRIVIKLPL